MREATHPDIQFRPHQSDRGRGFVVTDPADGSRYSWKRLPEGMLSFRIARDEHNARVLDSPSFAPLSRVSLVPDPNNRRDPRAVAIWNADHTLKLGYVPRSEFRVRARVAQPEPYECVVIWERREGGERAGVRLLLVDRSLRVGVIRGPRADARSAAAPRPEPAPRARGVAFSLAIATAVLFAGMGVVLAQC